MKPPRLHFHNKFVTYVALIGLARPIFGKMAILAGKNPNLREGGKVFDTPISKNNLRTFFTYQTQFWKVALLVFGWKYPVSKEKICGFLRLSAHSFSSVKGILHQKIFYCLNLIFWIVMGCGIARFGRRGLKTTETWKFWSQNLSPGVLRRGAPGVSRHSTMGFRGAAPWGFKGQQQVGWDHISG